jgi:hypothetical protein
METKKPKCSSDKELDAIVYCGECKIYMCSKCEQFHSKLLSAHQTMNLDKEDGEIFTGICKEPNHGNKLEFFCKNHNTLCCVSCTSKIGKKGLGLHKDCDVCFLEDIKEEKKEKFKSNTKYLEEISNTLKESIDNLIKTNEKIAKDREDIHLKIEKTFSKIRSKVNNREEEILAEVNGLFDKMYIDEKNLKKWDELPNAIKSSLEKGKKIESNDDKLVIFIDECINIENNLKEINKINQIIKKNIDKGYKEVQFNFDEEQIDSLLGYIKIFGNISVNNFDSSILHTNIKKQETIINWIREKTNKNFIRFEKIFIMNKNGSSSKDFHKYCDNNGPTLTLIKTINNKIFGGFTPLNWDISGVDKIDENNQTFIFSLSSMKKYDMINKDKSAICCNREYGPSFGASDFCILSNMKKGETYANEVTNFLSNNNLELTGGEGNNEYFDVDNFEVLKVLY